MLLIDWATFKSFVQSKGLIIQYIVKDAIYVLWAYDNNFHLNCQIVIESPASSDQTDFETNFKSNSNKNISQNDSDGASFSRVKQAPSGWTFQMRAFELTTATLSSLVNIDPNGSSLSDISAKYYATDETDLTSSDQSTLDASCVKTVLDFEPPTDYYIIGGHCKILVQPSNDLYLSVVAVPDVPYNSGGSRIMIQSVNMKYITPSDRVDADGRASKLLSYNATYHTNKLRFILRHGAGSKHSLSFFIEHYKQ